MRKFGAVLSSLPRSQRWQALTTDNARLTYVLLLSSQFGNSAGTFILPPELFDVTNKREPGMGREAYLELVSAGLIYWDEAEQIVQVPGWYKANAIASRKQMAGPLKVLTESLPKSPARDRGMAELAVHLHDRALSFSPDHEAKPVFLDTASKLIKTYNLHTLLVDKMDLPDDLLIALSQDLLIDLPIQGHRQRQDKDRDTDRDRDNDRDRDTDSRAKSPNSGETPSAPPSPPANRGRSGRKPDPETQRTIDELGKRAKGGK